MKKGYSFNKLRSLRIEFGFSQDDMAEKLSISVGAYSMKENGKTEFKKREIELILEIFGLSYEEIFLQHKSTVCRLTDVRANG